MLRQPLCEPASGIDPGQLARYSRHLTLPGVGEEGQRRIINAKVLIIGAGGLGSPIASYLIAAGVGRIGVLDDDSIELSNLQRQIMHRESDVGRPKVDSVQRLAAEHNSTVVIDPLNQRLSEDNALELFAAYDLVIDGSDNFSTRYLASDAAEITGTPLVWGTLFQFSGQVSVFDPRTGPMLRDIFPEIPDADSVPSCAEGGVFGALCGVVGSVMSTEALKLITGIGLTLSGKLWLYDALAASVRSLEFVADPQRERVVQLGQYQPVACAVEEPCASLGVHELAAMQRDNEVLVVDVRESWERDIIAIPHSIHVPLDRLLAGEHALIPRDAGIIVMVCKSGVRSRKAASHMSRQQTGTGTVYSLDGGTVQWFAEIEGQEIAY
ncbi:adenylyltransferase/sulfurtransferase MoeZ [Glutamicibacter halophytocola]|uniref:Adenylyltransferase/sulfurtransferase MoeZ n=1 Tax=Glutamicibacter halophytocola TaxID=1933880 RepID=A0ABX5Y6M9_9MICC|nr:ThiF family adenylyltransferase [Glutamicibacter halophytocola]NQD39767.1 adenylyltransferase/sulfurtransferase MoeZ [Glutamicibacter halophytocola]QDY65758.1 adenylyltransferase/sulfurtransferase MoeZ [Glutamicibacter halophytocola]